MSYIIPKKKRHNSIRQSKQGVNQFKKGQCIAQHTKREKTTLIFASHIFFSSINFSPIKNFALRNFTNKKKESVKTINITIKPTI